MKGSSSIRKEMQFADRHRCFAVIEPSFLLLYAPLPRICSSTHLLKILISSSSLVHPYSTSDGNYLTNSVNSMTIAHKSFNDLITLY